MMDESVASDSDGESGPHYGGQVTAKLQRLNEEQNEPVLLRKNSGTAPPPKQGKTIAGGGDAVDEKEGTTDASASAKKAAEAKEEKRLPCSDLIVLGLPYKFKGKDLREYFEKFGKVVLCEIKTNQNGDSKGFGFVQMATIEEQSAVLKVQHNIGGRKCQNLDTHPENVKVFVGRLTTKISSARLKEFFANEAKKVDPKTYVTDVFIPNPFRGFGFVTLSNAYVAKVLLKKEDFLIDDVSVCISPAAPKQQIAGYNAPSGSYTHRAATDAFPRPVWEYQEYNRYPAREVFDRNRFETSSPHPSGSTSLATGLETLNLNNMKPEVMNAAWKAFWSVASPTPASGQHSGAAPPPSLMHASAPPPGFHGNTPRPHSSRHSQSHRPFNQDRGGYR